MRLRRFMSSGFGLREVTLILLVLINLNLTVDCVRRHKRTPIWQNPCRGVEVKSGKSRPQPVANYLLVTGRGHRASPKPLRRLRTQVTTTYNYLDDIMPKVGKRICNTVTGVHRSIFNYHWLPINQSTSWYQKHIKCLDKKSKVLIILPKFQDGLQRYAASFEVLRSTKNSPSTTFECKNERLKVLEEMAGRLTQLLCELEKTMTDLRIPQGEPLSEEEAATFMPDFENADYTTGQLYDWGILSSYETYITEWRKIVRHVVGPKGGNKCANRPHRNKVQPLPT